MSVESGSCDKVTAFPFCDLYVVLICPWYACLFVKESTPELSTSGKDEATSMAVQAARQVREHADSYVTVNADYTCCFSKLRHQFGKELLAELPFENRREVINSKARSYIIW